uniref:Uncharacterized protein n=1 Tax=Anguilla anguilla TaxID=7936 RepID=A0A0E9WI62_ANGAN
MDEWMDGLLLLDYLNEQINDCLSERLGGEVTTGELESIPPVGGGYG